MDGQRFDELARRLATGGLSRRRVLKVLGGGLLGGLGGLAVQERVDAALCRAGGATCLKDAQCCSGACDPGSHQCACAGGTILCRGRCILLCAAADQCHVAGACDPGTGQCTNPAAADGTPCDDGNPCTQQDACQGGTCVGGPTISCGAQDACHVAGSCDPRSGACTNPPAAAGSACGQGPRCDNGVATGQDACDGAGTCATGQTTTCAPYVCGATACLTRCDGDDTACVSGNYCAGSKCLPKQPLGAACTAANQCESGYCVDGVCCDGACGAQCEACNLAGSVGTCAAVTGRPVGGRAACANAGTTCGGACDGKTTTACAFPGSATTCGQPTCSDGTETLAATCDGAGTCSPPASQPCGAYLCGATACFTSCTDDNQCVDAAYCDAASNTCKQDLPDGQACARDHQCVSGHCVDGVCCDTTCTDQCAACNVPGHEGTCSPAPAGAPAGGRPLCNGESAPGSGSDSVCGGSCDGAHTTCTYPGSGTTCGSASCANGTQTSAPVCDGQGNCGAGTTTPCAPYVCNAGGTACLATCESPQDCASGNYCDGTRHCVACTPVGQNCAESQCCAGLTCDVASITCRVPDGGSCTAPDQCQHNNCVNGTCCNTACAGACQTCTTGTCANLTDGAGGACTNGQVCQGGQCQTPCLALQAACTDANQCCQVLSTQCETVGMGTQTQCCRPPGIYCSSTADCCLDATCGTTQFGPNHCCYPDGHACDPNNQLGDCCAGSGCFGGVCCNATCAAGECGQVAKCGALIDCGACPNGEVCHNNACCTPQSQSVTCNGKCGPVTDNCGQSVQCTCDALHNCVGGQCVDCMQLGGTCGYPDYATGCCQSSGTTYCDSSSGASGDVCCHHVFGSCSGDYQCCGAAECGGNGTCCYPLNFQDCTSSGECCGDLVCASYCCKPQGAGCNVDGECCSSHCVFGACACIAVNSGHCASDSDCCAGGSCCGGICRNLQLDGYNCGSCGNDCGNNGINVHKGCCSGSCCLI